MSVFGTTPIGRAKEALCTTLKPFMPRGQLSVLADALRGEEREGIAEIINEMAGRIATMPVTYQQDGEGDNAIAHLHYFGGAEANFWILEKDVEGGVEQAFGLANLFGGIDEAEYGYISIRELVAHGIELDLYWSPKTIKELRHDDDFEK